MIEMAQVNHIHVSAHGKADTIGGVTMWWNGVSNFGGQRSLQLLSQPAAKPWPLGVAGFAHSEPVPSLSIACEDIEPARLQSCRDSISTDSPM
jgi:hypothetical protein